MMSMKRCSNPQHWDEPQDACLLCQAALTRYRIVTAGPHDTFQHMEAHETGEWLKASDVEAALEKVAEFVDQHQAASSEERQP